MIYKGSCHCGRISFEVEGELGRVVECLEGIELTDLQRIPYDGRSARAAATSNRPRVWLP